MIRAARDEVGEFATTQHLVLAGMQHVPQRWRALAAETAPTDSRRPALLGAADVLEQLLDTPPLMVLVELLGDDDHLGQHVRRVVELAARLEHDLHNERRPEPRDVEALLTAEQRLIRIVWERTRDASESERARVHAQLEELNRRLVQVRETAGAADTARAALEFAPAVLRITIATVLGGAVGGVLGLAIPGEDAIKEMIKGAVPGFVVQSAMEALDLVLSRRRPAP